MLGVDPATDVGGAVEDPAAEAEAARAGRPLADVIYDALLEDEGRAILCAYGSSVPDTVARTSDLIGEDNMIVALGDGGVRGAGRPLVGDQQPRAAQLDARAGTRLSLPIGRRAVTALGSNALPPRSCGWIFGALV